MAQSFVILVQLTQFVIYTQSSTMIFFGWLNLIGEKLGGNQLIQKLAKFSLFEPVDYINWYYINQPSRTIFLVSNHHTVF